MEWLNYHHLLYFWMTAREGTIAEASRQLRLAQPTITGQIRALETDLGEKLFTRSGRRLVLTEVGRLVYRYANEIFSLGRELTDVVRGRSSARLHRLVVGVTGDVLQLATLGAARVMKRDKTEGSIARGKVADFFLVDGDPLKNLGLFKDGGPHLSAIMKGGRFHKNTL